MNGEQCSIRFANKGYRNAMLSRSIGFGAPSNPFYGYPNPPERNQAGQLNFCRYGIDDGEACSVSMPRGYFGKVLDGTCQRGHCFQNEYRNRVPSYDDRYKNGTYDMPKAQCAPAVYPYTYY